jgi:6-phosphogluconate dehydrogenase
MAEAKREIGIVGLGKMGANLALQAMEKDIRVAGNDRSPPPAELTQAGLVEVSELNGFRDALEPPRAVFLYLPAGPTCDQVIDKLTGALEKGDIIVDAGNSYWGDSIRRHRRVAEAGLELVDLGTSGGISGARHGACFMAGGDRKAVQRIESMLIDLAVDGGYVHAGPPGAGHFTKLVHNGIEFGMLQAIGEGMDLLEHYREKLDIPSVLDCWRHGSVIRSWLMDLMHDQYVERKGLDGTPSYVEDTGEVNWLVDDAMHMEVSTPVIAQAVMQLIASRDPDHDASRAIAMMRHGFGGHPFGEDEGIRRERQMGRVGGFFRDGA